MEPRLESLPFEEWVVHVFDHPVREPAWYFDENAPDWVAPAVLTLAYITRLFNDPAPYLSAYDDSRLGQGFWYLVGESGSDHMRALTDTSAPLEARTGCIASFGSLFERLFAVRCADQLSHRSPENPNPLNGACYMWWDIIPFNGAPDDPSRRELDGSALAVMERILSIDSTACRESALHGLGHWHRCYPDRVAGIIDRAMTESKTWSNELTAYARSARSGCVL